jgi:hypothetical protein
MSHIPTPNMGKFVLPILFSLFFSTLSWSQTCTTTSNGEWGAGIFSCTGGATLATCTNIVINHAVTITGVTVTLNQAVTITITNGASLTINKSGPNDGKLNLTNTASTLVLNAGGAIIAGTGGNNNEIQIGPYIYAGNSFAAITAAAPKILTASGLPIQLSRFDLKAEGDNVHLTWRTETEKNNAYMAVEHSLDGGTWREIGRIQGAGNSTQAHDYGFDHRNPAPGQNYYRIRQADFDGTTAYSPVQGIALRGRQALYLWPNPAKDLIHVRRDQADAGYWELLSTDGRVVLSAQNAPDTERMDIELINVNPGNYFFRYVSEGQAPTVLKVCVDR